jgi:Transposase DDE domain
MEEYTSGDVAAQALGERLVGYVQPLLAQLDVLLDRRLVQTVVGLLQVILLMRHNRYGLLLSELGGYLLGPAQAPAGTKRISNLLRSAKWSHRVVDDHLWQQASQHVGALLGQGSRALVVWDESVIEKPESLASEGLCAVRSSKSQRHTRIKRGFYNPPLARPVFVPGYHWLAVMVMGVAGTPTLAAMRWWTGRGEHATDRTTIGEAMLAQCVRTWGRQVLHLFDRGYASGPWVKRFVEADIRFIVRWRTSYKLQDAKGQRKPGDMCRGKRSVAYRNLWDARKRCERRTGLLYFPVRHPQLPEQPFWLVVARPKERPAWHFLTNQPITNQEEAWQIIYAYRRRWQVETAFRYLKSELAIESPRLWFWHNRLKLFALVSLVYAFLLSLLAPTQHSLCTYLLHTWCHRTGERLRRVTLPLYRLRSAIVRLWLAHPVHLLSLWQNPG